MWRLAVVLGVSGCGVFTCDQRVVREGFGLTGLVVRLPLELDEDGRGLLEVQVSVLRRFEHDSKLMEG